jgi:hypothetical protein
MPNIVLCLLYRVQYEDFNGELMNTLALDFHPAAVTVKLHCYNSITGHDTDT